MGLYKFPHDLLSYKCNQALKKEGYVLAINTSGRVIKCAKTSVPFGVAMQTTESPRVAGSYVSSVPIAVIRHGVADVWVRDAGAISIGQPITISAAASAGAARGTTWTNVYASGATILRKYVVGIALEAKASAVAAAKVKCLLNLP